MNKKDRSCLDLEVRQQASKALLAAVHKFLQKHEILSASSGRQRKAVSQKDLRDLRLFKKTMRAYENMGILMATWFSNPQFLDAFGDPIPLTVARGTSSVGNLIRQSNVKISKKIASQLLRRSPSVATNDDGSFSALRRVFVLPEFQICRAALVVERYLETLSRNAEGRKLGTTLLLERSCYVPEIDLASVGPILRDIKERGTAFMDSTDGDMESCRTRHASRRGTGEAGVVVFAWTRPSKRTAHPKSSKQ